MKTVVVACVVCVLALSAQAADELPLRWTKAVTWDATNQDTLVAVPLDQEVFAGSADNFSDLRLIGNDGKAVPYWLQRRSTLKPQVERRAWSVNSDRVDFKPLGDGGAEIQIRLAPQDPQPDGIRLVTPLRNFEQTVTIFGTAPGGAEQELLKEAKIYDYSAYMDVSRMELPLAKSKAREFRVVVAALTSERQSAMLEISRQLRGNDEQSRQERTSVERRPFRIDRVEFWGDVTRSGVREETLKEWPVTSLKTTEDAEQKQTLIEVTTQREPLTQFTFETSSRNFNRRAIVQVREREGRHLQWRDMTQAQIHLVSFGGLQESRLTINFPETRRDVFRIVIENQDNPALEITEIKAMGKDYEAVFLSAANQKVSMQFGSTEMLPLPVYDTVAIRAVLDSKAAPAIAKLSAQTGSPDKPAEFNSKDLLSNRWLIGGAIVVLVGLLGWALVQAGKRIDNVPPSE